MSEDYCSTINAREPLPGTAPPVSGWVIIEAPGSWPNKPLLDGPLGALGVELAARTKGTATRVQLARQPERTGEGSSRRVWFAHTAPGGVRQRIAELSDLDSLLDVDLIALGQGQLPPVGRTDMTPHLFVCQNGKRDACCARLGRPLVTALAAEFPGQVYETTHLNGHRFAPTALLLPYGVIHGRLDLAGAREVLTAATYRRTVIASSRGRSALPQPLQVAELAVRSAYDVTGIDVLDVLKVGATGKFLTVPTLTKLDGPQVEVEVRHVDGRSWRVVVDHSEISPRPESCGGALVAGKSYVARNPEFTAPWWTAAG